MAEDTERRLLDETDTWRRRLDEALDEASPNDARGRAFLENIEAYRADADHFEAQDDPVRAFEAVVWAWAWLEIGARIDAIDWAYPEDGDWGPDAA